MSVIMNVQLGVSLDQYSKKGVVIIETESTNSPKLITFGRICFCFDQNETPYDYYFQDITQSAANIK